ncbi:MAG: MarR family transcriptional regulator [Clostridiales bacterium]|nr:MarR family transcriptional regulator [Clostridiales bacterium]
MQSFQMILNNMLIEVYHNIVRVEEEFLQRNSRINLTIREMHLIECVGEDREKGKTVSEIAEYLKIARPSVTVAVKKLEKKGYLSKNSCETDGRVVRVTLTREGRKVYAYHKRYHMSMIHEIESEFDESEQELLVRIIAKLNKFFEKSVGAET